MSQYGSPNEILAEFEAGPQSEFVPRRLFYVKIRGLLCAFLCVSEIPPLEVQISQIVAPRV